MAHGLKSQNFFPTVGASGPCNIHVNFGQMGFVFIEANVKKWGLAPMTGSLAPPPPYGNEQGSILLQGGNMGVREGEGFIGGHARSISAQLRLGRLGPTSPGPQRSPTEILLAQLNFLSAADQDLGEGMSIGGLYVQNASPQPQKALPPHPGVQHFPPDMPPPEYESPTADDDDDDNTPRGSTQSERRPLLQRQQSQPPIPTYEAAMAHEDTNRNDST